MVTYIKIGLGHDSKYTFNGVYWDNPGWRAGQVFAWMNLAYLIFLFALLTDEIIRALAITLWLSNLMVLLLRKHTQENKEYTAIYFSRNGSIRHPKLCNLFTMMSLSSLGFSMILIWSNIMSL